VRANTHLTTVMIAEKMADHLKQSVKNSRRAQPVG
jgi:choline dehydrogenase-like flavoprotein